MPTVLAPALPAYLGSFSAHPASALSSPQLPSGPAWEIFWALRSSGLPPSQQQFGGKTPITWSSISQNGIPDHLPRQNHLGLRGLAPAQPHWISESQGGAGHSAKCQGDNTGPHHFPPQNLQGHNNVSTTSCPLLASPQHYKRRWWEL